MHNSLTRISSIIRRRKQLVIGLSVFIVLVLAGAVAYAFQDTYQHRTNEFSGVYSLSDTTTQTATLTITKKVVNADGSALTTDQLARQFSFTLTFYKTAGDLSIVDTTSAYPYHITGGSSGHIKSGQSLNLSSGGRAVISALRPGTLYQVCEAPSPGYVSASTNNSGNIGTSGATAAFVNTYSEQNQGVLVISKRVVNENGRAPSVKQARHEFTFNAVIDGATSTFTLKNGEQKVISGLSLDATYCVSEVADPGYTSTRSAYCGMISRETTITLPFVNVSGGRGSAGSLAITKELDGKDCDPDKAFSFTATFEGDALSLPLRYHIDTKTDTGVVAGPLQKLAPDGRFDLEGGQTIVFEHLKQGSTYSVAEDSYAADGYQADISSVAGTIAGRTRTALVVTNTANARRPVYLCVKKVTKGAIPAADSAKLFHFIVTINNQRTEFDLSSGQTSSPLKLYQGDHYDVWERDDSADGWTQRAVVNGDGTAGDTDIEAIKTNVYVGSALTTISGKKTWDLSGAPAGVKLPESVSVKLMDAGRVVDTTTVKPDAQGVWAYSFSAPEYRADNQTKIYYSVEEVPVEGWTATVNGFNLVNTWTGAHYLSVTATKHWDDAESPARPKSADLQLYCDGLPYGDPVTVNASESWKQVWTGLDATHAWTVDEAGVPVGYTRAVTGAADTGFVITNTLVKKMPGERKGSTATTQTAASEVKPGAGSLAKTGDRTNITDLWICAVLLIATLLLLAPEWLHALHCLKPLRRE